MKITLGPGDALIATDVQNDFLPGGTLEVPGGDAIIPVLNRYIRLFRARSLPVFATRDWHPPGHCSFTERGGPWPPHCIVGTAGAKFSTGLELPPDAHIISKGTDPEREAYSGFEGTDLDTLLSSCGARRLFIGGLTAEYCVRSSVEDAIRNRYAVVVLKDATKAIGGGPSLAHSLEEMERLGAITADFDALA
jgi:nicotinamidase/pyrazinamidase